MANTTIGLVRDTAQAKTIVSGLHAAGFSTEAISVVFPDRHRSDLMGIPQEEVSDAHCQSAEGAVVGAATGGVMGSAVAWLVGIGAITLPGVGPLLAAGPILTILTGIGLGASMGGMAGALVGMGVPELDARHYESQISDGRILIAARADDARKATIANGLMHHAGAQEVATLEGTTGAMEEVEPRPPAQTRMTAGDVAGGHGSRRQQRAGGSQGLPG
jgi:hypothetical protein